MSSTGKHLNLIQKILAITSRLFHVLKKPNITLIVTETYFTSFIIIKYLNRRHTTISFK